MASCGTKPPPKRMLVVDAQAAGNINPSSSGRPSPVQVRVYELKAAAQFESADFVSLFEKDQAVLGPDIVVRDEFFMNPGESRTLRRELGVDSKFIAAMAGFRDLERARWRAVTPLAAAGDNAFTLRLDASVLQLAKR